MDNITFEIIILKENMPESDNAHNSTYPILLAYRNGGGAARWISIYNLETASSGLFILFDTAGEFMF